MDNLNYRQILIVNGNSLSGPQIVLPFFRPISIYEIEDDYDNLVLEIKNNRLNDAFLDEMLSFIGAFRTSLLEKNADPLVHYFIMNHGSNVDVHQIQDVFDTLDDFIEQATDENRLMH